MLSAKEAADLVLTDKEFVDSQVDYALENLDKQVRRCCSHTTRKCDIAAFNPIAKKIGKKLKKLGYKVKLEKAPTSDKHTMIYLEW